MPTVRLKTIKFPQAAGIPNATMDWDLSWPELIWAAVSVGKGSLAHVLQHGQYSLLEIVYRSAMVYANLLEKPDARFGRSDAYEGLDPSEKGAISYFLGLALTKAFVADRLGVPWLMHLDLFRDRFAVNLAPGERPDLFGQDALGRWIVAESKGRTNAHDSEALAKAKVQASQVIDVGGSIPHLSIGLVASFERKSLSLVADDPPIDRSREAISLKLSREEFLEAYYRPFRRLTETFPVARQAIGGYEVQGVRSESADLVVGISDRRIRELSQGFGAPFRQGRPIEDRDRNAYLGMDGVYVGLGASWREESMRLQPQER